MKQSLLSKILSLILIPAMLLSIASCGKKVSGKKTRKIASEDPWFNVKVYNIDPDFNDEGKVIEYGQQKLVGIDDKYIAVFSNGLYANPDNTEKYDSRDYSYYIVTVVDRNTGDKIRTIDLNQYLSDQGFVSSVEYKNGKITSRIYNYQGETQVVVEVDNDVLTGEKTDERDLGAYDGSGDYERFTAGEYTVLAKSEYDYSSYEPYYQFRIISSDGEEHRVDIKKDHTDLGGIPIILPLDDDKLLVPFSWTSTNESAYFEVDIKAEKAVEADGKDYEWIDFKGINNAFSGKDGQAYFANSVGISKIDMKSKKIKEFFNYNACPVNKELLSNSTIADCSENGIILLGGRVGTFSLINSTKADFNIYVITKATENPNAGKTVLELYAANGYVNQTISEAMERFNETNKDYYIEVTARYTVDNGYTTQQDDSEDDVSNALLQSNLSLNDKLAMDIMNGEGPDILVITDDLGRLNNPNNLVDLSKYLGDLDPEKYFTNVIDAAKSDGKLYQLPVTFKIKGIHTDAANAGASGFGFTPKEYEKFLYGPLNGCDVNIYGQAFYFTDLFNSMSDKFIVNGKIDLSGPEFAELAEFVKNNVPEKGPAWDSEEMYSDERTQTAGIARLVTYASFTNYLTGVNELKGARAILGIPSADGRGPVLCSNLSVAVSSQAVNIDACAEFAKILLTDEIQNKFAESDLFTVSREAFKKVSDIVLDYCNGPRSNNIFGINHVTFEPIDNKMKFTEDDLNSLENTILNCTHFDSADAAINIILIEEMPPYFLGQKDLKSVIRIAQDRAQKVLNER